jgi:hypothetical protein
MRQSILQVLFRRQPPRYWFRPCLEVLEDRVVLSPILIPVTSTSDVPAYAASVTVSQLQAANFVGVTLRDAINAANNTDQIQPGQTYLIQLQQTTYALNQIDNFVEGPNALPLISSNITIQGNGATLDVVGTQMRIFDVGGNGLGVSSGFGNLTLENLALENGVASGDAGGLGAGGAIFSSGVLNLIGVTLTNNQAIGATSNGMLGNGSPPGFNFDGSIDGMGGAIFNVLGSVSIIQSTLTGNTARGGQALSDVPSGSGLGGAVFNEDGAVLIADTTIAFNNALSGAAPSVVPIGKFTDGGGVYNLAITDPTIGAKSAATVTLINSIISNSNTGQGQVVADLTNNTFDFVVPTAKVNGTSDLVMTADALNSSGIPINAIGGGLGVQAGLIVSSADPHLGPLQNNGGLTSTMAITTASPAAGIGSIAALNALIAAGQIPLNGTGSPLDQAAQLRIDPGRGVLDVGSFEAQTPVPPVMQPPPTGGPPPIPIPIPTPGLPILPPPLPTPVATVSSPSTASTPPTSATSGAFAITTNVVFHSNPLVTPSGGDEPAPLSPEGGPGAPLSVVFVENTLAGPTSTPPAIEPGRPLPTPLEYVQTRALRLGASVTDGDDSVTLVEQLLAGRRTATAAAKATVTPSPTPPPPPAPAPPGAQSAPKKQSWLPWLVWPWLLLGVALPVRARREAAASP